MSNSGALAQEIQNLLASSTFGIIRFWGLAVVRPNDESFRLVSVSVTGDRIDIGFQHESGAGGVSTLSVWGAQGIVALPGGAGIAIGSARRLVLDDTEATAAGDKYKTRTPRGEAEWPIDGKPALVLAR